MEDVNLTFISILLVLISLSFVSRTDQIWRLKPRRSWQILAAGAVIAAVQCLYLGLRLALVAGGGCISPLTWMFYGLGLAGTLLVNETIKRQEIKLNVRSQKRARLEFGTKLGINSPF